MSVRGDGDAELVQAGGAVVVSPHEAVFDVVPDAAGQPCRTRRPCRTGVEQGPCGGVHVHEEVALVAEIGQLCTGCCGLGDEAGRLVLQGLGAGRGVPLMAGFGVG
jgi:hypothetical protein